MKRVLRLLRYLYIVYDFWVDGFQAESPPVDLVGILPILKCSTSEAVNRTHVLACIRVEPREKCHDDSYLSTTNVHAGGNCQKD